MGLAYIAAVLKRKDVTVEILDCPALNISFKELRRKIDRSHPDLVGITCMSCQYPSALKVAKIVKEVDEETKTVLGGSHPTALPVQCLQERNVDVVVVGEGEYTTLELVESLEESSPLSKVDGIAYKQDGRIIVNPRRAPIVNLDELPFPAWDLLPMKDYPPAPHGAFVKKPPVTSMITSRGCPFRCSFCSSPILWGRLWRARSPRNIVDEIEYLYNVYGIREIHFEDDNFTLKKKRVIETCDEIIQRGLDIVWACPNGVRIDTLDEEILKKMKESGCYRLAFGIESGSQRILDGVKKDIKLRRVEETIKRAKDIGIETVGFFMIGLLEDNEQTVRQTIAFAKKLPLDQAEFGICTPFPGSELYDIAFKKGSLETRDWEKYDTFKAVSKTNALSTSDLERWQKRAFLEFYLRPRILIKTLLRVRSLENLRWIIKRVNYAVLGMPK